MDFPVYLRRRKKSTRINQINPIEALVNDILTKSGTFKDDSIERSKITEIAPLQIIV